MAIAQRASAVVSPPVTAKRSARARQAPPETPLADAANGAVVGTSGHIRRCTYRRVLPVGGGRHVLPMYNVDCLHPSYDAAVPLGGLDAARVACAACTLPGIFRADED